MYTRLVRSGSDRTCLPNFHLQSLTVHQQKTVRVPILPGWSQHPAPKTHGRSDTVDTTKKDCSSMLRHRGTMLLQNEFQNKQKRGIQTVVIHHSLADSNRGISGRHPPLLCRFKQGDFGSSSTTPLQILIWLWQFASLSSLGSRRSAGPR